MIWKEKIEKQLSYAIKHNLLTLKYKRLVKDLLDGDTEFKMIYNNSNNNYEDIRMNQPLTLKTKKIILQKHNIVLLKYLSR
jgi:hypothetical protein